MPWNDGVESNHLRNSIGMKQNLLISIVTVLSFITLNLEAKPIQPDKPPIANMQVSYADVANLFKIAITATGSQDLDGTIVKTEVALGDGSPNKLYDGNFVKQNQKLAYAYKNQGRYTIKMTHTDNKGLSQSVSKSVDIVPVAGLVNKGIMFGPEQFKSSSNTYVRNISRTAVQAQDFYKVTIKNGDGLNHADKNCSGLSVIKKIQCKINNVKEASYRKKKRALGITFTLNNESLFSSGEFNSDTAIAVKFVRLAEQNQLRLRVIGSSSASIQMIIEQFSAPNVGGDTVAPVLSANVGSNTLTNKNTIRISIVDQSAVTTQVFANGTLISTQQAKEFDLALVEGANNFTLKATDAAQNKAADFVLSNITLDTVKPNILSDFKSQYLFNSLPKAITVALNVNESVKNVTVNGNPAVLVGPLSYSYTVQFTQAGSQSHIIKAQDMAGNETSVQQSVTVILDDVAPVITTNSVSAVITANEFDLNVTITDSLSVQSEIYLNEQLKQTTTEKNFTYKVVFDPTQHVQTQKVKIVSTDAVQNKTTKEITLKKDTTPLIVQIVAPVNNSILSSPVVEVRAVANKPLAVAKINNQVATIDADQLTVKGILQQPSEGRFTVTVAVTDIYGANATAEVQAEVKTTSLPSWTYEECPAK